MKSAILTVLAIQILCRVLNASLNFSQCKSLTTETPLECHRFTFSFTQCLLKSTNNKINKNSSRRFINYESKEEI